MHRIASDHMHLFVNRSIFLVQKSRHRTTCTGSHRLTYASACKPIDLLCTKITASDHMHWIASDHMHWIASDHMQRFVNRSIFFVPKNHSIRIRCIWKVEWLSNTTLHVRNVPKSFNLNYWLNVSALVSVFHCGERKSRTFAHRT